MGAEYWERLIQWIVGALAIGAVGILLAALGFKVFDWLCPKLDFEKELAEKQNLAVAILAAAIILGVSYIVATAVLPG
jgi:putative membrane protein